MNMLPYAISSSSKIRNYVDDIISLYRPKEFNSLNTHQKDWFSNLCLEAFDYDTEVILSTEANQSVIKYLLSQDKSSEINLQKQLRECLYERFEEYFDLLLEENYTHRFNESMYDEGFSPFFNQETGEILEWIR